MNWYIEVLKKYAVFSGRARRKEYWFFCLFSVLIAFVLGIVDGIIAGSGSEGGLGLFGVIYSLAVFVPSVAVSVRRLHDTGKSGWFLLLGLIPLIGAIVLLVFMVFDSEEGGNKYGSNPKS
jgi:uncharacterized membrane protein YhaH (DUF805 family)